MSLTFDALRAANDARQRQWDPDGKLGVLFHSNELAGETGEACNEVKKIERERLGLLGSRTTIDKAGDELADVVICADLVARKLGIDLGAVVARKFNATSEKMGLATRLDEKVVPAAAQQFVIVREQPLKLLGGE